jgi:two-component system response regulator FlrC
VKSEILVVEDDGGLREALCHTLEVAGFAVRSAGSGAQALEACAAREPGLVVSDVQLGEMDGLELMRRVRSSHPALPVLLMTAYGSIEQAVTAMREGAADYLVKPFEAEVLVGKASSLVKGLAADDRHVAEDPSSRALFALARRVARGDVTVLITGESGTGKEVLARFIHAHSARAALPFVAINCAAIPENMLEAILFGYEKGAFTGAHRACSGKFEQAQGGTLLLDEISEMALGLQAKLLRVLQEKEVERLGGKQVIPLDVRVLATSNIDMREAVQSSRFREDLYYRLNVFPLRIPPLRERPGDIEPLARRLLERAARGQGRSPPPELSAGAIETLEAQPWFGNVRELDNTLQRALILHRADRIETEDLVLEADAAGGASLAPAAAGPATLGNDLRSREQQVILEALRAESGNRQAVASKLGISPRTLRYKLAKMREAGVIRGDEGAPPQVELGEGRLA